MKITKELLIEKKACDKKLEWFTNAFPDGGDYQKVIDQAVSDDHTDYAGWLIDTFGATDDVLEISDGGKYKNLFFAGTIHALKSLNVEFTIKAGGCILASSGISAGGDILTNKSISAGRGSVLAGDNISARWSISADDSILAGDSISAGDNITAVGDISAGGDMSAGDTISAGDAISVSDTISVGVSVSAGDTVSARRVKIK